MANMHDYLRWRGDLSFAERPFNDADNLILAALSYLDFSGIVAGERNGGSVTVSKACQQLLERAGGDVKPYVRSLAQLDTRYVELLASSRRFGPAALHSYVDVIDEGQALQFAALQIDLPDAGTYVSYRGTDSTLVGWREDFMLSFCVTEAQREATRYLERALTRAHKRGADVRVGGHSKGGNLAEFAALGCSDEQRQRIVRVYSNDGPGMAPEVMSLDGPSVLAGKLRRLVPSYSVVGMLFAPENDPRVVVESSGTGIGQHDPTTWQLTPTGVQEAAELQNDCMVLNQAVADWAAGVPLDERARAVNEVFDALEAGGASRFDEITASTEGLQQVLRALAEVDERTRDLAVALLERTVSESMDAARKARDEALSQWKLNMLGLAEDALRKIRG